MQNILINGATGLIVTATIRPPTRPLQPNDLHRWPGQRLFLSNALTAPTGKPSNPPSKASTPWIHLVTLIGNDHQAIEHANI
jgi:hypothetical protein